MNKDIRRIIGARIRQAREDVGLTQEELAEMSGHTGPTISQWERGARKVSLEMLTVLGGYLKHDIDWFLTPPEKDKGDDPQTSLRRVLKEAQRLYERMAVSEIPLMGNVPCSYDDYQSRGIKAYVPVMLKSLPNLDATHRDLFALMSVGREVKSANISPGDTVVVDQKSTEIIDGKLYLVRVGNHVTIRMMLVTGNPDVYKLINENMEIEEVSFEDEQVTGRKNRIEILGRVVLAGGWKVY